MTIEEKVLVYIKSLKDAIIENSGNDLNDFDKMQLDIVATNYRMWLKANEQLDECNDLSSVCVSRLCHVIQQAEQCINRVVGQYALGTYNRAKMNVMKAKSKAYEAAQAHSLFDELDNENNVEEDGNTKQFDIVSSIICSQSH